MRGEGLQVLAGRLGALDGLVVQVGDVDQVVHLVAAKFEVAAQQVGEDVAAALAQADAPVRGGPAGVHADLARLQGFEGACGTLHGVEEVDLGLFPHREKRGAQVALAAVGQDHHERAGRHPGGGPQGGRHGRAAAHAHEEPLGVRQSPCHFEGLLVIDVHLHVEAVFVENFGTVGLLHVLEALELMPHERFDADDPDIGVEAFEPDGKPHGRAGGAQGGDHVGDRAVGLGPDLLGRAVPVGPVVGRVVELIGHKILVGVFAGQAIDLLDGPVRAEMAGGQQDFGPPGTQDFLPFDAGRLGHGQQQTVALDGAYQGQPDAGVARGGLDDGLARGECPGFFAVLDHEQGGPILDGSAGIHVFQLGQDAHAGMGIQPFDLHQGGVADLIDQRGLHTGLLTFIFRRRLPGSRVRRAAPPALPSGRPGPPGRPSAGQPRHR